MDFRASNPTHQGADAGDRRRARSGDAAGGRREPSRRRSPAPSSSRSTPRTSPIWSSRRPLPRPCSISSQLARRIATHGRKRTLRSRDGAAAQSAGRCLGRPRQCEEVAVHRRIPGLHHPRCLGRDLDPAALRRAHAPHPGDRHHARARQMGRIPHARARGADARAASRRTTSRRSSCSRRSIAACRPPITPSRKPPRSSPRWRKPNGGAA